MIVIDLAVGIAFADLLLSAAGSDSLGDAMKLTDVQILLATQQAAIAAAAAAAATAAAT